MKLTIERSTFLKPLSHIQSVVEKRTVTSILTNVRLEAGVTGLSLQATDMGLEIIETVFCDVEVAGCTTAPAHTLYDIVRKLPDGSQVGIEYCPAEEELVLRSGRSRFTLKCLPAVDFPAMTTDALPFSFTLKALDLHRLIERTRFAMSTEETRYYLNGIYFHIATSSGAEVLRAVTTDGHRLAQMEVPLPAGASNMPGIIVPRKTVEELRALIEGDSIDITISLSDTKVSFTFENAILISKLIDGAFPDYERVIPVSNDKIMKVNTKLFTEAVGRVSTVIATDKARAVKLDIRQDSLVLLASNTITADNAVDELEVSYDFPQLSIGFNSRYLLDVLGQIAGDRVHFAMLDSSSPTIIREVSDSSVLYVLMPMRV